MDIQLGAREQKVIFAFLDRDGKKGLEFSELVSCATQLETIPSVSIRQPNTQSRLSNGHVHDAAFCIAISARCGFLHCDQRTLPTGLSVVFIRYHHCYLTATIIAISLPPLLASSLPPSLACHCWWNRFIHSTTGVKSPDFLQLSSTCVQRAGAVYSQTRRHWPQL